MKKSLFNSNTEIFGCTDGSFVRNNVLDYKAGMGGFLKNNDHELLFIFSCPFKVNSALQAELFAVNHLVKAVVGTEASFLKNIAQYS